MKTNTTSQNGGNVIPLSVMSAVSLDFIYQSGMSPSMSATETSAVTSQAATNSDPHYQHLPARLQQQTRTQSRRQMSSEIRHFPQTNQIWLKDTPDTIRQPTLGLGALHFRDTLVCLWKSSTNYHKSEAVMVFNIAFFLSTATCPTHCHFSAFS